MSADDEILLLKQLNPHVRTWALVGYFLQNFAHMEQCLDGLLEQALGLDRLQSLVLGKNVEIGRKLSIAKVLVDIWAPGDAEPQKLLSRIHGFIEDRNVVAHDMFIPDAREEGDIQFISVKARTKFDLPIVVWSVEQVVNKGQSILETADRLQALAKAMKPVLDKIDELASKKLRSNLD